MEMSQRKRRLRCGIHALILTAAVVLSALLLYGILERRHLRWDLTASKELSLSDQTQQVLKGLDGEVKIVAFFRRGEDLDDVFIRRKVDDVLREYAARSSKIDYRMVDPDAEIELAAQYQTATDGTIVFQSGKNRKEIYKSQLFDYSEMTDETLPRFVGEGLFTNALLKVSRGRQDKICLLEGHKERGIGDTSPLGFSEAKDYLTKNNYEVESLSLVKGATPSECDLLLVAGASKELPPVEDRFLRNWLKEKGRLLLLIEPLAPVPLPETLVSLKIDVRSDLVLDPKRHFLLGPHYPAPVLSDHEITKDLQTMNPILSTARSLAVPQDEGYVTLLTTTPEAWGETDLSGTEPRYDKGEDRKGPLTLGVAVESAKKPLAIVVGDADFASNGLIQAPGNLDLFLNMVGWLVGDKDQIAIRPKTPEFRNLTLTEGRARFIAYFSQFGYPLLVLVIGGTYWFRRRKS